MFHYYYWRDSRITVNHSHPNWNSQENSYKLGLDGSFVEKCLWEPKLTFTNVVGLSSWRPTPSQSEGSPMNVYLSKEKRLDVMVNRFHVTIACPMDFSIFPFDTQVKYTFGKIRSFKYFLETKYSSYMV